MESLLIKNGVIVSPLGQDRQDVFVKDGIIAAIGAGLQMNTDRTIDAAGAYILPGGVDVHTHLDLEVMGTVSADDFESGTTAALAGGTTSIIDYVVPARDQSLLEALQIWKEKAKKAVIDYGFHMTVTWFGEQVAKEMEICSRQEGIPSFKAFLAYKDSIMVSDEELLGILKCSKKLHGLTMVHCENGEIVEELRQKYYSEGKISPRFHALSRPSFAEGESASRLTALARAIGVPAYIVHMSCRESTKVLVDGRSEGLDIFGETCPQYLLLDDSVYEKPAFLGAAYVMSPPIRPLGHSDTLWGALRAGQIQVVGTDHCSFNLEGQKELGRNDFRKIPSGAAGIEERMKLMFTYGVLQNKISLQQMVAVTSTNPARIFGMYPRKGIVAVGSDADLVIWQPDGEGVISAKTHHHKVDTNIFEGFKTIGGPRVVVAAGRVQFEEGKLDVEPGAGRFISRKLGL